MFGGSAPSGGFTFGQNNNTNQQQPQQQTGGLFGSQPQQAQQPQQNAFGSGGAFGSTFGAPQQQQPPSGGLFGSQPNAQQPAGAFQFGQPQQQQQQAGGAFGAKPATGFGSGFGATTNPPASGGFGFGANNQQTQQNTAFGTPQAGGGLFGAKPATGGLFGQPQQQPATGGGLFGQAQQPAATSGFFGNAAGASGPAAQVTTGTSNPTYQQSIIQEKDAQNNPANFAYQSISCMPQYKGMSLEELRVQDYEQGRKAGNPSAAGIGSTGGAFGFGQQPASGTSTTGGGLFGSAGQSTGAFGQQPQQQQSGGLFGQQPAQQGGSLFGQPQQQQQTGGLFGQSGQPAQSGGLFGNQQNSSTQPSSGFSFGGSNQQTQQPQQQQQPASTGFSFGAANNAPKPGGLFGGTGSTGTTGGFSFGQNNQQQQNTQPAQTGAFGGTSGFSFGNNAPKSATGGLFGGTSQPATSGSTPAFGGFGSTSTAAPGAAKPAFSFGGASTTTSGGTFGSSTAPAATGGLFGAQAPSSTVTSQPAASGGGLFGGFGQQNNQQSQQQPAQGQSTFGGFGSSNTGSSTTGGGLFGSSAAKPGGLFGSTTTQPAASGTGFGSGTTGGFNFGSSSNQQNQSQQQKPAFSFGGSSTTGGGLFGGQNNSSGQPGGLFGGGGTAGGSSLFGQSTQQPSTGGGLFGSQNNASGQSTFGSSGLFGNQANQQQQSQQQASSLPAQGLSLNSDPYGTDALFKSMSGGGAANQAPLPFNVSTSGGSSLGSSILSSGHKSKPLPAPMMSPFRPNVKNASRIIRLRGGGTPGARESSPSASVFGRSSSAAPSGADGLFRGLSDTVGSPETGLPSQAFVGRSSVKRLVLNESSGSQFGRGSRAGTEDLRDSVFGSARSGSKVGLANRGVAFSPALEAGVGSARRDQPSAGDESFGDASFSRSRSAVFNETPSKANLPTGRSKDLFSRPTSEAQPSLEDLPAGSYHLSPSLDALRQMSYASLSSVKDFTVTRKGLGSVRFLKPVDLTKVSDLSKIPGGIVQLREKEIWVYPQGEDLEVGLDGMTQGYEHDAVPKAKQGEALNVPAAITLEKCWPLDKATRQPLKDASHARVKQHINKLRNKNETRFVDYKPVEGTWSFEVDHFSRYGVHDTSEDESNTEEAAAGKGKAQITSKRQRDLADSPPKRSLRNVSARHSYDEDASPSDASESEDEYEDEDAASPASSDMHESELDDQPPAKGSRVWDLQESTPRARRSMTPRSQRQGSYESGTVPKEQPWAAQLGLEPRRVQVMQASFFGDRAPGEMEQQARTPRLELSNAENRTAFAGTRSGNGLVAGKSSTKPSGVATTVSSRLVEVEPEPLKVRHVALSKSLLSGRDGVPLDSGLAFGRHFRAGFGPGGLLAAAGALGPASGKAVSTDRSAETLGQVTLQKVPVFKSDIEEQRSRSVRILELQLAFSEVQEPELEGGQNGPCIFANPDLRFKDFAAKFDCTDRSHEASLWRLGVALFDEIDLKLPVDASSEMREHVTTLRRKAALSAWLRQTVSNTVEAECRNHATGGRRAAVTFSRLTGNQIETACAAAIEAGDIRLASLLAQIGGGDDEIRIDVAEQLSIWREQGVDAHISKDHRKIYELLAGNVTFSPGNGGSRAAREPSDRVDDLDIAGGLDWKRAFGLHLWYAVSHQASLTSAFEQYEANIGGAGGVAPPLPPHREKVGGHASKLSASARDALFQLIKIYAVPTFDLESALSPFGFGPTINDYRLPWHLYILLSRVLRRRDFADRIDLGISSTEEARRAGVTVEGNSARADVLTSDYAHQLEMQGQWQWAAFVLLHLELAESRVAAVKALIMRNVHNLDEDHQTFLTARLKVPKAWIFEAQATAARYAEDRFGEFELLVKAHLFSAAHSVAVHHLAPEAVIRGDVEMIFNLFAPFQDAFQDRLQDLPGWSTGGQVYVDYAACLQSLPTLIGAAETQSISAAEQERLDRLAPRVSELLQLVPALFPQIETDLNQIVAQRDMLGALHNLARVLASRKLGSVDAGADWEGVGVPPEVEHVQASSLDYLNLLIGSA